MKKRHSKKLKHKKLKKHIPRHVPKKEFPSISRPIPEPSSTQTRIVKTYVYDLYALFHRIDHWVSSVGPKNIGLVFVVSMVCLMIGVGALAVGIDLYKNIGQKNALEYEQAKVYAEIEYWEDKTQKYKNYKDAYLRLAILQYRLGNNQKALEYTEKALEIDPNFEKARELKTLLN